MINRVPLCCVRQRHRSTFPIERSRREREQFIGHKYQARDKGGGVLSALSVEDVLLVPGSYDLSIYLPTCGERIRVPKDTRGDYQKEIPGSLNL